MVTIPPLENVLSKPDRDTKKGLKEQDDLTGPKAGERVLYINLGFFKYGTTDRIHAAALVLSLILLFTIIALIIIGADAKNVQWVERAFNWLGSAFLFIAGIALGGKTSNGSQHNHNDFE